MAVRAGRYLRGLVDVKLGHDFRDTASAVSYAIAILFFPIPSPNQL
ncbi:hypothetical protein F7734_58565 [Scytonema sp. UIC 10036]|nr:hypothetical protein [Scytonema sp. UIC 10036]MUH01552.1 hypothetical protein [Scytonema sp. UIC 10036]